MKEVSIILSKDKYGYTANLEADPTVEGWSTLSHSAIGQVLDQVGFWDDEEELELYEFQLSNGATNLASDPGPDGEGHGSKRSAWGAYKAPFFHLYRTNEEGSEDPMRKADGAVRGCTREEAVLWVVEGVRPEENCFFYNDPGHTSY